MTENEMLRPVSKSIREADNILKLLNRVYVLYNETRDDDGRYRRSGTSWVFFMDSREWHRLTEEEESFFWDCWDFDPLLYAPYTAEEFIGILYYMGERNDPFNIPSVSLCSERNERVSVFVDASFTENGLTFSCQDFGPAAREYTGGSDYEYWYTLDRENTGRLLMKLNDGPWGAYDELRNRFSGVSGMRRLREFCELPGHK